MPTSPKSFDQNEEQLALLQIGCIAKDISLSAEVGADYIPTSLEDVADILDKHLHVKLERGDNITQLRDRVVQAYLDTFTSSNANFDFDHAMKGI